MGSKFQQKKIFESAFDSFEFDDGFLMKVDSDLKKYKSSENQNDTKKINSKAVVKREHTQEKQEKKIMNVKRQCYDSPLLFDDLDESDFFDLSQNRNKKHGSKVSNTQTTNEAKETSVNNFISCLSPVLSLKTTKQKILSSSTPVKPDSCLNSKEELKLGENSVKDFDYGYFEADLFDDWDINEGNGGASKSVVNFSQALRLIEQAESVRESDQKESLNQSIDLLTGEAVGANIGVMFDEPFDLPKSGGKKQVDGKSSTEGGINMDDSKAVHKPLAAQKLNFESDKANSSNFSGVEENHSRNIFFNSDDDLDFLTQDLVEKSEEVSKCAKPKSCPPKFTNANGTIILKDCDLNESSEASIRLKNKHGKCFNIIESDSTEDSPSPKFRRQIKTNKKVGKRKNSQKKFWKEFIDSEAEVSDQVEISSDELDEDGEYDKSFLDEESYYTQNCSLNMQTKYLESVKTVSIPGSFKIPAPKAYNPVDVFSQIPEDSNTDYEIDSFCVNEVEDETEKQELSDLEIAERILEMDRKEKKRKRLGKLKK